MTESHGETQKPAQALHIVFLPYKQCKPGKTGHQKSENEKEKTTVVNLNIQETT